MRRVIVGTAGHIDHGKTTLIKVLTGIDTDRLKEEKERGITIDIGFAHLTLPSGTLVGIVDVPGHERFIRNMVAGASGIDLVMLVVAADEGVMPQTIEHVEICELLGIKDGIVVLTKVDLVEKDWLELIKEDLKEFLKNTFLKDAPILEFSAVTGQGKEEILKTLDEKALKISIKAEDQPFRLPVDGVFTIKGFGTVARGTAISGKVSLNQTLMVYPKNLLTKVRNIQVHGKNVEVAYAGMRTALNLQGVEKEEIERGDVLADLEVLKPSQWLDVKLNSLKSVTPPIKNFETLLFYIGTKETLAKIFLLGKDQLNPGETDIAQIFVQEPVVAWRGDRFILRRTSTNQTVGGGEVLNPVAYRRKRTKPWERKELEYLSQASEKDLIKFWVEKREFLGIYEKDLQIMVSIFGEKFKKIVEKLENDLIKIKEGEKVFYFSKKAEKELKEQVVATLKNFHTNNPFSPGLTKELLKARISSFISEGFYQYVLEDLINKGVIGRNKEILYLTEFKYLNSEEKERLKKELEEKFLSEGYTPRDFETILLDFKENYKAAKELAQTLLREGILVKLTDKLVFHAKILEEWENLVREAFQKKKELEITDFKNLPKVQLSRKFLIPLVEYLDKKKVTLRVGDKRILRKP
ncbi:selenocysteine-specific translation elongation factor [Thermodesulfobacterium sp. TA1]|uniref:selenocysteine-specific translation elongation factor n=1 Tax=Thermodesulfobacterium sp. TA1 TaxID=2234087 RepID=UPI001232183D|nr:selenocysteine-specific translation elongation factor [Thermodesulfobacterium sp. TA1]QER41601.1 selenocysteine-specific translation elongation factor [Thermodesulfobacterium sp. TA1]